MKTSYGLEFTFAYKVNDFTGYDRTIAECHMKSYGLIIIDSYGSPIDNENDLSEIARQFHLSNNH